MLYLSIPTKQLHIIRALLDQTTTHEAEVPRPKRIRAKRGMETKTESWRGRGGSGAEGVARNVGLEGPRYTW